MSVDIYIRRAKTNVNIVDDIPETENLLELFLQQIEMTLSTNKTSVLGAVDYGINLQYFLHELKVNKNTLTEIIQKQIETYCELSNVFNYTIYIDIVEDNTSKMLIVDIIVEDSNLIRVVVD